MSPSSRRTRGPCSLFAVGLVLALGLLVPLMTCQEHRICNTCSQGPPEGETAVGFNLGQSYGTSVAYFSNGTITNLAKVRGSSTYAERMEQLILKPQTPYWLTPFGYMGRLLSIWRRLKRTVGLPATTEEALLAELLRALKDASEAALQTRINTASVAAPQMAAWQDVIPVDSTVNNALVLAGLEPYDWEATDPSYLTEVNALLASDGRQICKEQWCFLDDDSGHEARQIVYHISFTNRSLYTSLRPARCFFQYTWEEDMGSINADLGLDKLNEANTPGLFWSAVQELLLSRVTAYTKRHPTFASLPFLVLVAGEAGETPEFLAVVQSVIKGIPGARATKPAPGAGKEGDAELVVSDDPTFSAAKGAAFWLRMRMDRSYCEGAEGFDSVQSVMQEAPKSEGHVDL
ncbi:Uncharacterized protein TCAP_01711 [Tolypocladium capitatum]|uniref:Uncharacterized protein n=1 Tax=Tolypocladium capitatum TaxID=45235 RepID=A0A2K3QLE7_9HYPO|nr:Uncharacterized protein TCAP_01711 [Tolypocladium capitatum]